MSSSWCLTTTGRRPSRLSDLEGRIRDQDTFIPTEWQAG